MYQKIKSVSFSGATSLPINVEISATPGLPQETIIGLPDTVIKESRARIKSAILLSGFKFPAMSYVINLSPTDVLKRNISLELAMTTAFLMVTEQVSIDDSFCFIGSISLDGGITPIRQILPLIYFFPDFLNFTFVISKENERDIAPLDGLRYIAIEHLTDLKQLSTFPVLTVEFKAPPFLSSTMNFDEVRGHTLAKKACVFSIIGRHPLLFIGSPGIGKTMLIQRMQSLAPPLGHQQSLENCCMELLINNQFKYDLSPPYRNPHHSISYAGMIGGKNPPQPGEITRANHGILFLDELGEYHRHILETLREPLENKCIQLSRAGTSTLFPADFLFLAAMNPCYCGHYFDTNTACRCLPSQIQKYWQKISQPFLDRISLCVILTEPNHNDISFTHHEMISMVETGISISKKRNPKSIPNQSLEIDAIYEMSSISEKSDQILTNFLSKHQHSIRAKRRILQLSRTIADANNETRILNNHITMAIQLSQHHHLR